MRIIFMLMLLNYGIHLTAQEKDPLYEITNFQSKGKMNNSTQGQEKYLEIKLSFLEMHGDLNINRRDIEPSYYLTMVSEKMFELCNYEISYSTQHAYDTVIIKINGVPPPAIGLPMFGPAKAYYKLPDATKGEYFLKIINGNAIEIYKLIFDEEKLILEPISENIKQSNVILWRFPRNSFAFICNSDINICDSFNKILLDSLQLEEIKIPEEGIWPLQGISNPATSSHFYKYYSSEEYDKIEALLDNFTSGQKKYQDIYIVNWRNKNFSSKPLSSSK